MRGKSIRRMIVVVAAIMFFPSTIFAAKNDDVQKSQMLDKVYGMQIPFIENRGQINNEVVQFYANILGGSIYAGKDGTLTYNLPLENKGGIVLKEIFADKELNVIGLEPSVTEINYFKGKDKKQWKTNIPSYDSISFGEVYNGVTLTLKAYGNNVEKLFTVLPEQNPKEIKIKLLGAKSLEVNERGELEATTELGIVKFTKPVAYQEIGDEKKLVEVTYNISNPHTYGFKVANYDSTKSLVIDPLLASTFIGGNASVGDHGVSVVLDENENVYLAGYAGSDFPSPDPGFYDETHNGYIDVFIAKFDKTLSTLLASTFIGGPGDDQGGHLTIDEYGNVYVTGTTTSSDDFPVTSGAYDESHNGGYDAFIAKFDSTLSTLIASTYFGDDTNDYAGPLRLALDGSGDVYLPGAVNMEPTNFPTTTGAYDETYNGGTHDGFVAKLDRNLSNLLSCTYLGGDGYDGVHSLRLDSNGNVYVTGDTTSSDLPTTPGANDETLNGGHDVFVIKLNGTLNTLLACTYIGGDGYDAGLSLSLDGSDNLYITGMAESNFPTTLNAYDESHNGGVDVFVTKIDNNLSSPLLASTYIGGGDYDRGLALTLDDDGNVYVTGSASSGFPTTLGAYDQTFNGGSAYWKDAVVLQCDSTLSTLRYSTYLGGSGDDLGASIALDETGNIFVAGTASSGFPTTPGAYDESHNGGYDAYVAKLNLSGLVGHWKFDGDPTDSSGYGNDGIEHGVTPTQDRCGNSNSAYNFQGANGYIEVPHADVLNPENFTISLWVKFHDFYYNASNVILEKCDWGSSTSGHGYFISLSTVPSNGIHLSINDDEYRHYSGYLPNFNEWVHVAGTYDQQAGVTQLYINGSFIGMQSGAPAIDHTTNPLLFGKIPQSSYGTNGAIDDIRIYNQVLSETEILKIMNECGDKLIPDTGQTKCYDDVGSEIPCPLSGDLFYGQDSQYITNAQSYTKLDVSANDLPNTATEWVMVRDNVTELVWEVKTLDNKDDTYNWQDAQDVFIADLNAINFGGFSDWRIPTIKELSFIVNRDGFDPVIDTDYFPYTVPYRYWSSTSCDWDINNAWTVFFHDGYVDANYSPKASNFYVRAVRGAASFQSFLDNGDGTITDTTTGLMWQQDGLTSRSWEGALLFSENLSFAGYDDWRLPNIHELQSLVNYSQSSPAINSVFFTGSGNYGYYWTSTTFPLHNYDGCAVQFQHGSVNNRTKSLSSYVRAVRGGLECLVDEDCDDGDACTIDACINNTCQYTPETPPPVNQQIGFDDTVFNNLVEADCRVCHDDPAITGPTPNVDRHHLLYGSLLPEGECSVNRNLCLSDADCDAAICSTAPTESCSEDTDCDDNGLGETCGEVCIGETVAPFLDANNDGVDDNVYSCLSCHAQDDTGGVISFLVERDCLQCHIQIPGEGSVHHLTPTAQGPAPIGDPAVGDCTPCHGTLVDDIGDGHAIPTYDPSLVTPDPSGGNGEPINCRGNGAGACNYCHDDGTDAATGVQVYTNNDTHHNTGVYASETGVTNSAACLWCHNYSLPEEYDIRTCEGCHGYESLHNIQADSDGDCCVTVGEELPGYGHVGADNPGEGSDCWGCHGFSITAAPGSGPTVPFISSSDLLVMITGTDTQVTLVGSGFTNTSEGSEYISNVLLTADDASSVQLTPDAIDACSCTVTIPGTTATGNYTLQAVKEDTVLSNPVALSVKPPVEITEVTCSKCLGTMTITGLSFSERPEGTDEDMSVMESSRPLNIISWTDNSIEVSGARCAGTVSVNTLYGSASWQQ